MDSYPIKHEPGWNISSVRKCKQFNKMVIYHKINHSILDQIINILFKYESMNKLIVKNKLTKTINTLKTYIFKVEKENTKKINEMMKDKKYFSESDDKFEKEKEMEIENETEMDKEIEKEKEMEIKKETAMDKEIEKDIFKISDIKEIELSEENKNKIKSKLDLIIFEYYLKNREWYSKHLMKFMKDNNKITKIGTPFYEYDIILDYKNVKKKEELLDNYISIFVN